MAPATFVRTAALLALVPGWLTISSVGPRYARFRRRRGCGRSISRLGQPVSMLVLVGRLPSLWRRSEPRGADLSKILGFGSLLLSLLVLWNIQSPSTLRSGPVDGCSNGRRQFTFLLVKGILARIEPGERSDWGGPDRTVATRVMPPGKE